MSDSHRGIASRHGETGLPPFSARQAVFTSAIALPVLVAFVWSYLPTLIEMVHQWDTQPDYSHGYFVIPVALFLLWVRRDSFPGLTGRIAWSGLLLLFGSLGLRWLGGFYFLGSVDAWSMVIWCAGVVWLFAGWRVLCWASPAVAFLFFMIPLPYSAERMLSLPLQRIATKASCIGLRFLGQPALAEGNTIRMGETQLEVVQACSGLRIFVGILALAFAYMVIVRRPLWQKAIVALSVIPVTLCANSCRIIMTGLLSQYFSSEAAHKFTHDLAGWFMIPFAAGLFALVLWYLNRAFVAEETVAPEALLQMSSRKNAIGANGKPNLRSQKGSPRRKNPRAAAIASVTLPTAKK